LAYGYIKDEPGRQTASKPLTHDEAKRIAANIAELPELRQAGQSHDRKRTANWPGLSTRQRSSGLICAFRRLRPVVPAHRDQCDAGA